MDTPRVGLVITGNTAESGLERADGIRSHLLQALGEAGLEVCLEKATVTEDVAALNAAQRFRMAGTDLVILVNATWTRDTIPYLLMKETGCPLLLVGLPYPETYSLASLQHFASLLKNAGQPFKSLYGDPSDPEIAEAIVNYARVVKVARNKAPFRMGLIGPRSSWRAFGAQDMTDGEWELGNVVGSTIIHIEMDEFRSIVQGVSAEEIDALISRLRNNDRIPAIPESDQQRLQAAAAEYVAIEELQKIYGLSCATIQTYPNSWGSANLAAAWLADEGFILETEGDLVRTALMSVIMQLSSKPSLLGELAHIERSEGLVYVGHAGSCGLSLAQSLGEVAIANEGEVGCFVQFPIRQMPAASLIAFWKRHGVPSLQVIPCESVGMTKEEWTAMGGVSLAKLRSDAFHEDVLDSMVSLGMEHHLIVSEGALGEALEDWAHLRGVAVVAS
jgi:L-fucose isomerase-like protein